MSEHGCVGKSTQALQIPIADCPDVGERHIDGNSCLSSFSLDTTERDDFVARRNELFGDEVNVESVIEAREKAVEHVLEALEMAAGDRHPLRQIVDDMRRLQTAQRLAMSRDGSFVESADAPLVFFFAHGFHLSLYLRLIQ